MASKSIDIVVNAKDNASGVFNGIAKNSASFADKIKANLNTIKIASWAMTAWLIAMWKKFVEAWNVQIEQETKLTTILKQRANATDAQIQKIKDLASAEQNLWIVWDEVQLAWAQQLATFVNQTETIEKLLPAMNNLVAQQKWYNATTWDAINIWNLMWKVLQWQTSALTRVWITFTEAQEQVLKFWNEEERASMLAQVITDNVWEMNKAMAWTFQGRLTQLNNTIWDIWETIWMALMPALQKALEAIIPVVNKVADWIAKNPELTANILLVTTAVAWLTFAITTIVPVIWTLIAVLSWPAWRILALAWVVTGLQVLDSHLKTNWEKIAEYRKELEDLEVDYKNWTISLEEYTAQTEILNQKIAECEESHKSFWWYLKDNFIETFHMMMSPLDSWKQILEDLSYWIHQAEVAFLNRWISLSQKMIPAIDSIISKMKSLRDWAVKVANKISEFAWGAKSTVAWRVDSAKNLVWFANWGSVQGNVPILVWERWPEVFVPSNSWTIIPNNQITNNNWIEINLNWVNVRSDSDIDYITNEIIRKIKLEKSFWIA